jgi:hypothetical protein
VPALVIGSDPASDDDGVRLVVPAGRAEHFIAHRLSFPECPLSARSGHRFDASWLGDRSGLVGDRQRELPFLGTVVPGDSLHVTVRRV